MSEITKIDRIIISKPFNNITVHFTNYYVTEEREILLESSTYELAPQNIDDAIIDKLEIRALVTLIWDDDTKAAWSANLENVLEPPPPE